MHADYSEISNAKQAFCLFVVYLQFTILNAKDKLICKVTTCVYFFSPPYF